MKKLIASILIVTFAGLAFGQTGPTNAVKISQLTTATVPLGGTELLPITQGGVTKSATVANLWFGPNAMTTTTSNSLQSQVTANGAAITTLQGVTNALNSTVTSHSTRLSNLEGSTNALQSQVTANSAAITTLQGVTNALNSTVNAQSTHLGNLDGATNNLQTQINSINTQLGNVPGTGSTVSFTRVILPTYVNTTIGSSGSPASSQTINIDATHGQNQQILIYASNGGGFQTFTFKPVNFSDGDNITLEIDSGNTTVFNVATVTSGASFPVDAWAGPTLQLTGSTKEIALNWNVVHGKLNFTALTHQ